MGKGAPDLRRLVARNRRDLPDSARLFAEALTTLTPDGDRFDIAEALAGLADLAAAGGQPSQTAVSAGSVPSTGPLAIST